MRSGQVAQFGTASPLAQISSIILPRPHLSPEGDAALEELMQGDVRTPDQRIRATPTD